MKIAIMATQTVFLGTCRWKYFENRLVFAELWQKKQCNCFFL